MPLFRNLQSIKAPPNSSLSKVKHCGLPAEATGLIRKVDEAEGKPYSSTNFRRSAKPCPDHKAEKEAEAWNDQISQQLSIPVRLWPEIELPNGGSIDTRETEERPKVKKFGGEFKAH